MTRLFELIPDLPMFDIRETGIINHAKDGIVTLAGLRNCSYGQKLVFRSGATGMIIGFDERAVQGVVFDDTDKVSVGDTVAAVPQQTTIPVGDALPGRVIDVLGVPLDGRGAYTVDAYNPVFRPAPGIMDRIPLEDSMPTGTKIVDLAIPVGKGQRELIIGDRQSGKSTIALDAIINQKGRNTICI